MASHQRYSERVYTVGDVAHLFGDGEAKSNRSANEDVLVDVTHPLVEDEDEKQHHQTFERLLWKGGQDEGGEERAKHPLCQRTLCKLTQYTVHPNEIGRDADVIHDQTTDDRNDGNGEPCRFRHLLLVELVVERA